MLLKSTSLYVYFVAALINIGSLMVGLSGTWSSSAVSKLNGQKPDENPLGQPATKTELSFIVSLMSVGLMVGPLLSFSIDTIGRKNSMLILMTLYGLCFLMLALAKTVWLICVARALVGVGNGWAIVVMPNYLSEISLKTNRGKVSCLMKVFISFGMFLMYCIGPYLSIFVSSVICLVPLTVAFFLTLFFVPESPYYLVGKGDLVGGELALKKLRRSGDVSLEFRGIVADVEESFQGKGRMMELFTNLPLFKCLLFSFGLFSFQQLNGSTSVLFYMQNIFESAGSNLTPEVSSIIVGFIQSLCSISSPLLVDRLGRRFLLLASCSGTLLCLIALATYFQLQTDNYSTDNINWLPITSLIIYFVCYALGIGPVPYTLIAEIFPPNFKAFACSLVVIWLGLVTFIITVTFPSMIESIGTAASFWTYAGFSVVGLVYVYYFVPETKNKSFLEIQKMMKVLKD